MAIVLTIQYIIQKRITAILHAPTFTQAYQNGVVIDSVQNVLEVSRQIVVYYQSGFR